MRNRKINLHIHYKFNYPLLSLHSFLFLSFSIHSLLFSSSRVGDILYNFVHCRNGPFVTIFFIHSYSNIQKTQTQRRVMSLPEYRVRSTIKDHRLFYSFSVSNALSSASSSSIASQECRTCPPDGGITPMRNSYAS